MKLVLRSLIWLLVVLWLGGILFFPVIAAVSFGNLPDQHMAGTVTRLCLTVLHKEGLSAGAALLLLLLAAGALRTFGSKRFRPVAGPIVLALVMLALTAFSQFVIIPHMDRDRISAGGDISVLPREDAKRADFDRLHAASEKVEEGVLLAGVALVVLLARRSS